MGEFLEFDGLTAETFTVDQQRRTLTGVVVPYGQIGRKRDGSRWRFSAGSMRSGHAKYIRLNNEHVGSLKLGRATWAEDTPGGLVMTFRVFDGPAGDAALAAAQAGRKTGFSVEVDIDTADMSPAADDPGLADVAMANLTGVAFTADPAFTDARLIKVAASQRGPGMDPETTPDTTPETTPETTTDPAPAALTQEAFAAAMQTWMAAANPATRPVVDPTRTPRPTTTTTVDEPVSYAFSRSGDGRYHFSSATEHDFSRDLMTVITAQLERRDPGPARAPRAD